MAGAGERIEIAVNRVNPLDFNEIEQIQVFDGTLQAIPTGHDPVYDWALAWFLDSMRDLLDHAGDDGPS